MNLQSKTREFFNGAIQITVEYVLDEYPDLSYLGEYGNTWKPGAIDRQQRGDWERHEMRYFYPTLRQSTYNYYRYEKGWQHRAATIEAGYVANQDYKRFEAFNKGDWDCIGIIATVFVNGLWLGEDSIWGIESDSGDDYLRDMEYSIINMAINHTKINQTAREALKRE